MIFFSEPSHFALVFGPFLLYMMAQSKNANFHFFICVILGLLLKNMTLLVFALYALLIISKAKGRVLIFPIIFIGFYVLYLFFGDYFAYFVERVAISSDSDNLSVLVLLSGYERAYLGLFDNFGLGVGFQQMGVVGPLGSIQEKMALKLNAIGLNLFSGGTFFSKIVVEFGVTGAMAVLGYVSFLPHMIRKVKGGNIITSQELFYFSCYIMFAVIIFIRGAAYFTPSFLFLLTSICFIVNMRSSKFIANNYTALNS